MPDQFESPIVMQQMSSSGLLETIKIHKSGYEFRESIESFVDKFWPLTVSTKKHAGEDAHMTLGQMHASFNTSG